MIKGFMESSLATSEVFIGLRDSLKVQEKAVELIKTAKHLTNEDIEAAYISVKQISDSLTREAMKAFDSGRVVLVYNDTPSKSITQAVPFLTFKTKNGYITYVFIDKYVSMSRDNVLSMQAPILRDLLTGAMIANGIKRDYQQLSSNQYLQQILMEMYNKFFTRVINREFSIAADKQLFDIIQYWVNRFFLENVFGSTESLENIDTLAKKHVKYLEEIAINDMKVKYEEASPSKISDLLNLLKSSTPRMKTIGLGTFMSDWTNYYYAPAYLAVDNVEYLIFMCITLLSGNNIINISASDVVKEAKNIKSFRGELLKLI